MENYIYILNPIYFLRNDNKKVLLYSGNQSGLGTKDWLSYIHPIHAMILSFFTKDNPFFENVELLGRFLGKTNSEIIDLITPFIENEKTLHIYWHDCKILFPPNVLVKKDGVEKIKRTQYQIQDFLCKIVDLKERRSVRAPLFFTLMLNNHCITKCAYCYADKNTKGYQTLETNRILDIIEEAHFLQMQKVNIIGGEIFLHKDWDIILKRLVDYNMSPEIISTKIPITSSILEKLKKTGFKNPIQISLDTIEPSILKKDLSVKSDYLHKLKKSLLLVDSSGIRYQIATILTRLNDQYEVINDLYIFLKTLTNVESWRISPAWNSLYIDENKFESIKSSKERIKLLYYNINNSIIPDSLFDIRLDYSALNKGYFEGEGGSKTFKGGQCTALQQQMFVLPDGQVTICEQLYWKPNFVIGNLRNNSIEEVWNSEKANALLNIKRTMINKNSSCSACKLFDDCFTRRCWVDVVKAYGDENWDYPDPRCHKAPAMKCNISF